jgi:glyoxylase-like metal-dependent hydrolase (beta-lactamase superfamily II)
MSEPLAKARKTVQVVPGVHRWFVHDERIGAESDAYAVVDEDGTVVLIDPLPIDEDHLRRLGRVASIVLTAGNHQRSAWRFRRTFGAPVWIPEGARGLEEKGDLIYTNGDSLPGGLIAYHTPGPTEAMYTLWMPHPRAVLFLADLLTHEQVGRPRFVPSQYLEDPMRTRQSVQRILDHLPLNTVCFAHGEPIVGAAESALRLALYLDSEAPGAPAH